MGPWSRSDCRLPEWQGRLLAPHSGRGTPAAAAQQHKGRRMPTVSSVVVPSSHAGQRAKERQHRASTLKKAIPLQNGCLSVLNIPVTCRLEIKWEPPLNPPPHPTPTHQLAVVLSSNTSSILVVLELIIRQTSTHGSVHQHSSLPAPAPVGRLVGRLGPPTPHIRAS